MSVKWCFTKDGVKIDSVGDAWDRMKQLLSRHTNDELLIMVYAIENILGERRFKIKIKTEERKQ